MTDFEIGQEVVKQACPEGCICDGSQIPDGTAGVITETAVRQLPSTLKPEQYLCAKWNVRPGHLPRLWWVFEHAVSVPPSIPDMFYLDP